jgi:signal transduction histidine kinase
LLEKQLEDMMLARDKELAERLIQQMEEFEKRTEIKSTFKRNFDSIELEKDLAITIFRIFQESLTNIYRHAEAKTISVRFIKHDSELSLTIKDDGKGITNEKISDPKSFGLIGMRERLSPWDGLFMICGVPNKGTTITIKIPLNHWQQSESIINERPAISDHL